MYTSTQNKRIFGLDLMRATAIMMVLFGHCLWLFPIENSGVAQIFQLFSFLGVELFFVLSGFLIGGILYREFTTTPFSLSIVLRFLKRRWFRTLPNYYLVLIINILLGFFLDYELSNVGYYVVFLQNFSSPLLPFFPESWSLSVEEWAYLLLPLALFFMQLYGTTISRSHIFLSTILLFLLAIFGLRIGCHSSQQYTMAYWNLAVKSVVIYRLDAILYGVLASWIRIRAAQYWQKLASWSFFTGCIGCLTLFLIVPMLGLSLATSPFFWNVFYLPLVSIGICFFLPVLSAWETAPACIRLPVTFISQISYSIYLIHYSCIMLLCKVWIVKDTFSLYENVLVLFGYLICTLVVSYFLYRFFEKPIMELRDKIHI